MLICDCITIKHLSLQIMIIRGAKNTRGWPIIAPEKPVATLPRKVKHCAPAKASLLKEMAQSTALL
ncbi:hypothetical protein AYI96_08900 [Shewanella sp. MSW]|jgi:hypothetical protein|nr:hypothetical protein BFS86_10975 [Shewanella algae]TVP11724.1 hypothetical protein AYI96_08900 [Shewanella sp. MSW]